MGTKLSVFCDKVIEAGWLAAAIVEPLFFNVYSSRVFEPDKLTTLRSIATVMVVAWIIKTVESGWEDRREGQPENGENRKGEETTAPAPSGFFKTPMVLPTLFIVAVYLLSTVASIVPRTSLWGSYQRLQGTYTTLSYIVIFLLMLNNLRSREQVDRLVNTIIAVSVPISLYGIIQHFGKDPLPWGGDVTSRVASNMGNAIFVAAYLIMATLLTLGRLVESLVTLLSEEKNVLSDMILTSCYVVILAIQLLTIMYSDSRGPWLGLLGGIGLFIVLLTLVRRHKRTALTMMGLGMTMAAFLLLLNVQNGPLNFMRSRQPFNRLATILDTKGGTNKVRILIWEGVVDLVLPHEPIRFPSGAPDPINFLRPLVGYGPESMYVAYNRFYPPELAHHESRNASPDRSHNETFDSLVITGLLGFVAYVLLFGSFFYYGLKSLGLINDDRQRKVFTALWLGGGAIGAMVPVALGGRIWFIAVSLPMGMVVGLGLYLVAYTLFFYESGRRTIPNEYQFLLVALVSAVAAHFIEINFGIAIAATRTYFWIYTGLLVVVGFYLLPRREPAAVAARTVPAEAKTSRRRRRRRSRATASANAAAVASRNDEAKPGTREMWAYALVAGLIMVVMVIDYVTVQFSLTAKGHSMLWLFSISWILGGAVMLAYLGRRKVYRSGEDVWVAVGVYILVSLGCMLIFAIIHKSQLTVQFHVATLQDAIRVAGKAANTITIFNLALLAMILALAAALLIGRRLPARTWQAANWWLYPILIAGAALLIVAANINVIRADIYYKQAQPYEGKRWDFAIEIYKKALSLVPKEDFYYLFLGRAYLESGQATQDPNQKAALLEASYQALLKAQETNPLNTDHSANLGRLFRTRAGMTANPQQRAADLNQSIRYYTQATSLSPHNAQLLNEMGQVYYLLGQFDKALAQYLRSEEIDPQYPNTYVLLGDVYQALNQPQKALEAHLRAEELSPGILSNQSLFSLPVAGFFEQRLNFYMQNGLIDQFIAALEKNPQQAFSVHYAIGTIYLQQGKMELAAEKFQRAIELRPDDLSSHIKLGYIYDQQGKLAEAEKEFLRAVEIAPDDLISHRNLGVVYGKQGRLEEAQTEYERCIAIDPNDLTSRQLLADVYSRLGKLDEALQEYQKWVELSPNDFQAHRALALLLNRMGRLDEAIAEAKTARDLAPDNEKPNLDALIAQLEQNKSQ